MGRFSMLTEAEQEADCIGSYYAAIEALRLRDRASKQIRVEWLSTGDGRQFACVGSQLVHGAPVWLIEPDIGKDFTS
jgi:hypothetical protein